MTIKEFVIQQLFECCLWEDECSTIFEYIKVEYKDTHIRWDDTLEGYPEEFKKALTFAVVQHAITWLKANNPNHFAVLLLQGE